MSRRMGQRGVSGRWRVTRAAMVAGLAASLWLVPDSGARAQMEIGPRHPECQDSADPLATCALKIGGRRFLVRIRETGGAHSLRLHQLVSPDSTVPVGETRDYVPGAHRPETRDLDGDGKLEVVIPLIPFGESETVFAVYHEVAGERVYAVAGDLIGTDSGAFVARDGLVVSTRRGKTGVTRQVGRRLTPLGLVEVYALYTSPEAPPGARCRLEEFTGFGLTGLNRQDMLADCEAAAAQP